MRKLTIGLALAGSIAGSLIVIALSRRVVSLNKAYSELKTLASTPHVGYAVPTLRTSTLTGDSVVVGELADTLARQVVLVFTTTCQFCRATIPVWQSVFDSVSRMPPGRLQIVALSLDSTTQTRAYALEHQLRYPIAFFPDWKSPRFFRARTVPQTLILNAFGVVVYSHIGLLEKGPGLDSLFQAFTARAQPVQAVSAR